MHNEIQVNKDYIFTWKFYDRTSQLVPSAATVNIFDKGGTSIVSTVGSTDANGTITYTFLEAANDNTDINFKIVLDYTVSSVVTRVVELFDVVNYPLINLVREDDLFKFVPELRNNIFEVNGESTSLGSTTTIVDTALTIEDRQYKGGRIELLFDEIHEARITNYAKATGTITFSPAYASAVPSGTKYILRDSYQDVIDIAYNDFVHRDIRNKVGIKAGYIDSEVTKNLTIAKSLEMICMGAIESEDDKWDIRRLRFFEMYQNEFSAFAEPYDTNQDGNISDTEDSERPQMNTVDIIR